MREQGFKPSPKPTSLLTFLLGARKQVPEGQAGLAAFSVTNVSVFVTLPGPLGSVHLPKKRHLELVERSRAGRACTQFVHGTFHFVFWGFQNRQPAAGGAALRWAPFLRGQKWGKEAT